MTNDICFIYTLMMKINRMFAIIFGVWINRHHQTKMGVANNTGRRVDDHHIVVSKDQDKR